jgi:cell wall-associated NlpC family hydrolase
MLVDDPVAPGAPRAAVAGGRGAVAPPAPSPPTTGAAAAAARGGNGPPITHPPKYPALQGRAASSPNRYVRAAGAYEGTPYDRNWRTDGDASDGTQGIDCSGLVGHVYGLNNSDGTPMTTGEIDNALSQPGSGFTRFAPGTTTQQPGDILMWPGHTGIAADADTMVHAPQPGWGVEENYTKYFGPATIFRPDPSAYPP